MHGGSTVVQYKSYSKREAARPLRTKFFYLLPIIFTSRQGQNCVRISHLCSISPLSNSFIQCIILFLLRSSSLINTIVPLHNKHTLIMKSESSPTTIGSVLLAPSAADFSKYDLMYYIKGALAGGICCSITHGALTPVDVVKTRVQLDSVKVCISKSIFPFGILLYTFSKAVVRP